MQAHEHLVKLRFEIGKILKVIEAQFVAYWNPGDTYGQSLHGAQGGRGQTNVDARRARLGQNHVLNGGNPGLKLLNIKVLGEKRQEKCLAGPAATERPNLPRPPGMGLTDCD